MRRNYQRHTNECGGIDPVVVHRILNAGTIQTMASDHVICDCERAYIAAHADSASRILLTNTERTKQLKELWYSIQQSEDSHAIVYNNYGSITNSE